MEEEININIRHQTSVDIVVQYPTARNERSRFSMKEFSIYLNRRIFKQGSSSRCSSSILLSYIRFRMTITVILQVLLYCRGFMIHDATKSAMTGRHRECISCRYPYRRETSRIENNLILESKSISSGDDSKRKQKSRKRKKSNANEAPKNIPSSNILNKSSLQSWRVYGVEVHPDRLVDTVHNNNNNTQDVVSKFETLHPAIIEALHVRLNLPNSTTSIMHSVTLIRRSVDARCNQQRSDQMFGPRYIYVLDVVLDSNIMRQNKIRPLKHQPGRIEEIKQSTTQMQQEINITKTASTLNVVPTSHVNVHLSRSESSKPRVIIVGAGPAGLFCALQLAKSGCVTPIILERGQPVETRGKDIGALIHRRSLNTESNFAFGEGGAGTWSDGKLTTRIGRNSDMVRKVLETFVQYGAPSNILIEGAPHLGTDNLVRLLRNMRIDLRRMGGVIHFGTKVTELLIEDNITIGVKYIVNRKTNERNVEIVGRSFDSVLSESGTGIVLGDAVVMATGHSARDVYEQLYSAGVKLEAKGFAVGFRVEHPQKLINSIQYGGEWGPSVLTGKRSTDIVNLDYFTTLGDNDTKRHEGKLPVPSYRLATDKAHDGKVERGVYSFCMCPGGQIVPASTDPNLVCVNGMSFSRRDSLFANSALVVTIDPDDEVLDPYRSMHGVLAGIAFQRDMERRAASMGGGNFVVPVQRVTDFISNKVSTSTPSSSYRLGVKPAACHLIYPGQITNALKNALTEHFNRQMPGFICDDAVLHAVETRTSSPVRIIRDLESFQAIGTMNLFPAGEGAGFAGGIVSAAVDGLHVADAILRLKYGFDHVRESNAESMKEWTSV
jgi:uncharacterized FAD-dependent dehydrogenase